MDRRKFLRIAGMGTGAALMSAIPGFASLQCTMVNPALQQCEAGIQSSMIHASALQRNTEWCWAACIEMVFGYYGFNVPQERIVRDTWGDIVNMPGQPGQILANLNRAWTDDSGRSFSVSGDTRSASPVTAAQDLDQNYPLIVGALGHAMVLTSLVYMRAADSSGQVTSAIVRDPWPG